MKKQIKPTYTTIRIKTTLADKIKDIAKEEGRKIEVVAERLIEKGLEIKK